MNAQELRVGNMVMRYSNIMEVSGIGNETADLILIQPNTRVNWRMLYEDIFPIPLTEEWLLKFGFYIDSDNAGTRYVSLGRTNNAIELFLVISKNALILSIRIDMIFVDLGTRINYVHQLQNLTRDLTGQELTLNK